MTIAPVQNVLDKLEGVKQTGEGKWEARCPAHDDKHASLSISKGDDGRALLCCHAGCQNLAVVKAIGLKLSDLFVSKPTSGKKKIVATYDYMDSAGKLLYQVVRYDPKDFRQRKPDGNGHWVWGLNEDEYFQKRDGDWYKVDGKTPANAVRKHFPSVPRVLYRLPELLAADKGIWAFIPEGEKDADNLAALGLVATTNPGGASKWSHLSSDDALHGRRACIIADNDGPGQAHAQDVARRLHGKATDVRVIAAASGKDASDWIAAGATADDFIKAAEAAPTWAPTTEPSPSDEMPVSVEWRGGAYKCYVSVDGVPESADLSTAEKRAEAVGTIMLAKPDLDVAVVEKCINDAVAQRSRGRSEGDGDGKEREPGIYELLIEIGQEAELAHDAGQIAYARVDVNGHQETWPVASRSFRLWLGKRLYDKYGKSPYGDAVKCAVDNVTARALYDAPEVEVGVRVMGRDGAIYLDLCNDKWQVAQITTSGWKVLDKSPVWFRRARGMWPLPIPDRGGSVDDLRPFVNLRDDSDFVLVVAWLLAALAPLTSYPALNVSGEQGSAKSTLQEMLRMLVDPNKSPLRDKPKEPRDLNITAKNGWALGFDNFSSIADWLSDAFCRMSTGGGFATRELCTDDEETIFEARRPLLFNGIPDLATKPDLIDRCISIMLSGISPHQRKDKASLMAEFEQARPRILGALLDAIAAGLTYQDKVRIAPEDRTRMYDFQLWVVACERALPWKPGTFTDAYLRNRRDSNVTAIESSVVAGAIQRLMDGWIFSDNRSVPPWEGTHKQLLADLNSIVDDQTRHRKDWPSTEEKLAAELRRIAPNLRADEIDLVSLGKKRDGSHILLRKINADGEPVAKAQHTQRPLPGMHQSAAQPVGA